VSQQPPLTEAGLLSYDLVTITNHDILISIRIGYDFFCDQHHSLDEAHSIARKVDILFKISAKPNSIQPRELLAWQSKVHVNIVNF